MQNEWVLLKVQHVACNMLQCRLNGIPPLRHYSCSEANVSRIPEVTLGTHNRGVPGSIPAQVEKFFWVREEYSW